MIEQCVSDILLKYMLQQSKLLATHLVMMVTDALHNSKRVPHDQCHEYLQRIERGLEQVFMQEDVALLRAKVKNECEGELTRIIDDFNLLGAVTDDHSELQMLQL